MSIIRKQGTSPFIHTRYATIQLIEKARPIEDYISNKVPMQSDKLKIRLLNEGYLQPVCDICGKTRWLDEEIPLQLDHRNGNDQDNSLSNVRLLCPNCHAQTPWYRIKDEHKGNTTANEENTKEFNRQ